MQRPFLPQHGPSLLCRLATTKAFFTICLVLVIFASAIISAIPAPPQLVDPLVGTPAVTYPHSTTTGTLRLDVISLSEVLAANPNFTLTFKIDANNFNIYTRAWPGEYSNTPTPNPTGPVLFEFGGGRVKHFDKNSQNTTSPQTCSLEVCPTGDCSTIAYPLDIGLYSFEGQNSRASHQNRVYLKSIPSHVMAPQVPHGVIPMFLWIVSSSIIIRSTCLHSLGIMGCGD